MGYKDLVYKRFYPVGGIIPNIHNKEENKIKKKIKRKARTTLIKGVDLLLPVDITKLGTEEDVCFGKHHDPQNEACLRCGDAELCQIVKAQRLHKEREKIEKKSKFRDMEEKKFDSGEVKKQIRKLIRNYGSINKEALIEEISQKTTITKAKAEQLLTSLLKVTNKFTLTKKGKLVWNKGE